MSPRAKISAKANRSTPPNSPSTWTTCAKVCAPADYQKPDRFFARTYLTKNLASLATEVVRRLSGHRTETNAVFNLATQFGGGKTHALTLLYHLARKGPAAHRWAGVPQSCSPRPGSRKSPRPPPPFSSATSSIPSKAAVANDGTPLRKTPWADIAWQLGGAKAFALVAEHEKSRSPRRRSHPPAFAQRQAQPHPAG